MSQRPPNRKLSPIELCLSIATGILHDAVQRRKAMFTIVLAALVLLFIGSTLLAGWLRAHPWVFLFFWLGVAWLTLTSILLAIYDMLMMRKRGASEIKRLRQKFLQDLSSEAPDSKDDDPNSHSDSKKP